MSKVRYLMENDVTSYHQSTRKRGVVTFILLTVIFFLAMYFNLAKKLGEELSRLNNAPLAGQILVFSICFIFLFIITSLIVTAIKDIFINAKCGLQLYENHLTYTEPNNWIGKSYKLEYEDIVEIHKEYYGGDSNEYFLISKDGKKYSFPNLSENSTEEALDKLALNLEYVKVVIVN